MYPIPSTYTKDQEAAKRHADVWSMRETHEIANALQKKIEELNQGKVFGELGYVNLFVEEYTPRESNGYGLEVFVGSLVVSRVLDIQVSHKWDSTSWDHFTVFMDDCPRPVPLSWSPDMLVFLKNLARHEVELVARKEREKELESQLRPVFLLPPQSRPGPPPSMPPME